MVRVFRTAPIISDVLLISAVIFCILLIDPFTYTLAYFLIPFKVAKNFCSCVLILDISDVPQGSGRGCSSCIFVSASLNATLLKNFSHAGVSAKVTPFGVSRVTHPSADASSCILLAPRASFNAFCFADNSPHSFFSSSVKLSLDFFLNSLSLSSIVSILCSSSSLLNSPNSLLKNN